MIFNILAQKLTGEQLRLLYDNEANVLQTESGFVFGEGAQEVKPDVKPFSKDSPLRKSRDVAILKIQLGLSCNYSCEYCSQRFVERAPETSKKDVDVFMAKIESLRFSEKTGLKIELWGGEPFVYWKTIKPLVARLKERLPYARFSVITNGSILTEEICYWLMVNDFSVAISHDGPGQAIRGPDPFDDPKQRKIILDFWRVMHRMRRISFNAMLTAGNYSRAEIHKWFVDLTGDPTVALGEGGFVDAYDEGGMANLMDTKAKHFQFRKTAFNDIYSSGGDVGFVGIVGKIDAFTKSVLAHSPATSLGQKCGMDMENVVAVDLRGNVVTCQNVSAAATSHNGESHHAGNIEDMDSVRITTATHWRNRAECSGCPVLHICKGSCMYIEGKHWTESCANAYSDAVALFALAVEKITDGYVPVYIDHPELPPERRDIWGTLLNHDETPRKRVISIRAEKLAEVDGVAVYTQPTVMEPV